MRPHHKDGLNTDRTGKLVIISEPSVYLWHESHNEFGAKVTVTKFGNSQRSLPSPTGGVKSIPLTTENWLRKRYKYNKKNYKSTEDKHETNRINKYNDMNMNTQDAQHLSMNASAHLVTLLMLGHMHLVAQVLSPVMSSMYMCGSP